MTSTVLITGCSSGFGAAAARAFASKGWNVVATARRPEDAQALASEPGILVTRLDVQDSTSIDGAIAAGIERFGRIDVLVNNAGFGLLGLFETTSREKIQEQLDVNLFGAMNVTRGNRECEFRRGRVRPAHDLALLRFQIRAGRLLRISRL